MIQYSDKILQPVNNREFIGNFIGNLIRILI